MALAPLLAIPVLAAPGVATADDGVVAGDTVVGEFAQIWPEYKDPHEAAEHGDEGPLSFVRTGAGESVRVDTADVPTLDPGAVVRVTVGRELKDTASEDLGYDEARNVVDAQVLEAAPTQTAPATAPVTDTVTVVMVKPAGGVRDSRRLSDLVAQVNGPVADFWNEQSDGTIRLAVGTSYDWIDTTAGCSDPFGLWSEVARRVGFTAGAGKHLLLYVGTTSANPAGCSYGLGTVGGSVGAGGLAYVSDVVTSVIAHELGHNFGLGHSSLRQCDGDTNAASCQTTPYYDLYDVMGASWSQVGSLSLAQAARLVPIQSQTFEVNSPPATVTLTPVSQRAGVRGVMLRDTDGVKYWLEYRPASGRDAWLGTTANQFGLQPGVLLREETDGQDTSLLLDGTPSGEADWGGDLSTALPVGSPVRVEDSSRGGGAFDITVVSTSSSAATVQVTPKSAITVAYEASGGPGGPLGAATGAETCAYRDAMRYCERSFANGSGFWTEGYGAHLVYADIFTAWTAGGGAFGTWGIPAADAECGLTAGGCEQTFSGGALYWSSTTGAVGVRGGALLDAYRSVGEESGIIGYPTAAEVCGTGGGCRQAFQGAVLATSSATGTQLVPTGVATVWASQTYEAGPLGYPTTGLICGLKNSGCGQVFQGGRIYSSPAAGTHAVTGGIHDAWIGQGAEKGALAYATGDAVCGLPGGACKQEFQGGTIYWTSTGGARSVVGSTAATWAANGAESGVLGAPTTGLICGLKDGACGQVFQGGRIYSTSAAGTHAVSGAVETEWINQGREYGPLGYPTDDQVCGLAGGACKQVFQGGVVDVHPTAGTRAVTGVLATAYLAAGGETGALGFPSAGAVCGLKSGGCAQLFQGGRIYSTPGTGTRAIVEPVLTAWLAQGWEYGPLGYPTTGLICGLKDGACGQVFQGGRVYSTSGAGTHALSGPIEAAWIAQGREVGPLGYPSSDLTCGLAGGGCKQSFEGGALYFHPTAGTRPVSGAIAATWAGTGAEGGALGYPIISPVCGLKDGGCGQLFQGGRIYTNSGAGTHAITGAILAAWLARGWETGPLGYPSGDQVCGLAGGGCKQAFQGGTLYTHPTAGTYPINGSVGAAWTAAGSEGGALGYPTSGLICGLKSSGCGQLFQGGRIYDTAATGAHAVSGAIQAFWIAQGRETGTLGYATGDQVCGLAAGGCKQDFQGGTVYSDPTAGTHSVSGPLATAWATAGGEGGLLGYPTSDLICGLKSSGCGQVFQGGRIYATTATGAHAVSGAIYTAWVANGFEVGPLGYATSDAYPVTGGTAQDFQGGTLTLDNGTGQVTRS